MTERIDTLTRGARWTIFARIRNADGTAFNLTDYTATADFNTAADGTGTPLGSFAISTLDQPDADGNTEGFDHTVQLRFEAPTTAAYTDVEGYWDVKVVETADTDNTIYPRGTSGKIIIRPRVTA